MRKVSSIALSEILYYAVLLFKALEVVNAWLTLKYLTYFVDQISNCCVYLSITNSFKKIKIKMFNVGFIDYFDIVEVPSDMCHDITDEVLQIVFVDFIQG